MPTLQLSPAIRLIGDVDTVRVARTAQAKTGVVRGDLLVLRALSEVDFLFASLLPARGTYAPTNTERVKQSQMIFCILCCEVTTFNSGQQ